MRIATIALLALACNTSQPADPSAETDDTDGVVGPGDTDQTTDTSTPAGDDDDDDDVTTLPMPAGWNEVDDAPGAAMSASMDAAFAADGTLYVSWVDDRDGEPDVYVASSVDGGVTWTAGAKVDDEATAPLVASGRQPYLTVTDTQVHLTFTTSTPSVELWTADRGAALSFAKRPIALDQDTIFVDYAKSAEAPDGTIWVTWHQFADGLEGSFQSARTSNGLAVEETVAYSGTPCECCRIDLRFTDAGVAMLAFRNNETNIRNQWVLLAQPGDTTFTSARQASNTDWNSYTCPMQGPRLAELSDGTQLIAFADQSSGAWMVYLAQSSDSGVNWTGDRQILPSEGGDQRTPTIAVDADDTVWVTALLPGGYALASSTDGGDTFTVDERLDTDPTNITEPFAVAAHGMAAVGGVSAQGRVLLRRLR